MVALFEALGTGQSGVSFTAVDQDQLRVPGRSVNARLVHDDSYGVVRPQKVRAKSERSADDLAEPRAAKQDEALVRVGRIIARAGLVTVGLSLLSIPFIGIELMAAAELLGLTALFAGTVLKASGQISQNDRRRTAVGRTTDA